MKTFNKNIKNLSTTDKVNLTKDTYNAIAEKYVKVFYNESCDHKYINKFLKDIPGLRVLDVGCGMGKECKYVQDKGYEAIGIDYAEEMIKEAKKTYPTGKFEVMDVNKLSFPAESFDGIIFINSLFHIPKLQIDDVFSELNRVLKEGGKMILIFQEGNEEKLEEEPLKKGALIYMQHYSLEFIEEVLKKYNLKIYDYERELVKDKNCPIDKKLVLYVTKK